MRELKRQAGSRARAALCACLPLTNHTALSPPPLTCSEAQYRELIAAELGFAVGAQEALGLDVLVSAACMRRVCVWGVSEPRRQRQPPPVSPALDSSLSTQVHGEPERSDMVEYFGLKLDGYFFTGAPSQHTEREGGGGEVKVVDVRCRACPPVTDNPLRPPRAAELGWVQSYGSRYTRPPIVTGDISRSEVRCSSEGAGLSKQLRPCCRLAPLMPLTDAPRLPSSFPNRCACCAAHDGARVPHRAGPL